MTKVDVKKRFSHEINDINNKFIELKNKRVYEISGVKSDGFLQTNIEQLEKMVFQLLNNIENDMPSFTDKLGMTFEHSNLK